MGRKFQRLSLGGGMHDEAESTRGHRAAPTSAPCRDASSGLKQAGTRNPSSFLLDEVDKLGNDFAQATVSYILAGSLPGPRNRTTLFSDHYLKRAL